MSKLPKVDICFSSTLSVTIPLFYLHLYSCFFLHNSLFGCNIAQYFTPPASLAAGETPFPFELPRAKSQ